MIVFLEMLYDLFWVLYVFIGDFVQKDVVLCDVFGFSLFCLGQEEVVDMLFFGQDVLVIMLMGLGKLFCYQVFVFVFGGLMVVVLLFVVLMEDQVVVFCFVGVFVEMINFFCECEVNVVVWCCVVVGEVLFFYFLFE